MYGSLLSREEKNNTNSPMSVDRERDSHLRKASRQDSNGNQSNNTFDGPRPKKKNKSVFDEYEQRGGVLEGYEDLNACSDEEEEDQILSQIRGDQSDNSNQTSQKYWESWQKGLFTTIFAL